MSQPGKNIAVLGSTGSIGRNALEVISNSGGALSARVLSAHNNLDLLREQAFRFRPRWIVVTDPEKAGRMARSALPEGVELLAGSEGITRAVGDPEVDIVLSAIVGSAGLQGTWAALEAGKPVALANKESLVMAGPLVMRLAEEKQVRILPVDSEHSAVFQAMQSGRPSEVQRLILTASGGPFRTRTIEQLAQVSVAEALAHPTWDMGPKVTIDSATLMNKALEIIEARWLFNISSRADRSDDSPAVDRAFDGRICGWFGDRPVESPGHEAADPVRPDVARALRRGGVAGRLAAGDAPRF